MDDTEKGDRRGPRQMTTKKKEHELTARKHRCQRHPTSGGQRRRLVGVSQLAGTILEAMEHVGGGGGGL